MAKNNSFLARIQREKEEVRRITALVMAQQAADAAIIALNECFQFGPERSKRFFEEYQKTFQEIARLTVEDEKSDREIAYTRETVDRRLKSILGDRFQPWEVRYRV